MKKWGSLEGRLLIFKVSYNWERSQIGDCLEEEEKVRISNHKIIVCYL